MGYWKLKEQTPDSTMWRTCVGRGCGPVVTDDYTSGKFECHLIWDGVRVTMSIKPTSAYENKWIYYIISFVNLPRALVTLCDYLQGGVFSKVAEMYKKLTKFIM